MPVTPRTMRTMAGSPGVGTPGDPNVPSATTPAPAAPFGLAVSTTASSASASFSVAASTSASATTLPSLSQLFGRENDQSNSSSSSSYTSAANIHGTGIAGSSSSSSTTTGFLRMPDINHLGGPPAPLSPLFGRARGRGGREDENSSGRGSGSTGRGGSSNGSGSGSGSGSGRGGRRGDRGGSRGGRSVASSSSAIELIDLTEDMDQRPDSGSAAPKRFATSPMLDDAIAAVAESVSGSSSRSPRKNGKNEEKEKKEKEKKEKEKKEKKERQDREKKDRKGKGRAVDDGNYLSPSVLPSNGPAALASRATVSSLSPLLPRHPSSSLTATAEVAAAAATPTPIQPYPADGAGTSASASAPRSESGRSSASIAAHTAAARRSVADSDQPKFVVVTGPPPGNIQSMQEIGIGITNGISNATSNDIIGGITNGSGGNNGNSSNDRASGRGSGGVNGSGSGNASASSSKRKNARQEKSPRKSTSSVRKPTRLQEALRRSKASSAAATAAATAAAIAASAINTVAAESAASSSSAHSLTASPITVARSNSSRQKTLLATLSAAVERAEGRARAQRDMPNPYGRNMPSQDRPMASFSAVPPLPLPSVPVVPSSTAASAPASAASNTPHLTRMPSLMDILSHDQNDMSVNLPRIQPAPSHSSLSNSSTPATSASSNYLSSNHSLHASLLNSSQLLSNRTTLSGSSSASLDPSQITWLSPIKTILEDPEEEPRGVANLPPLVQREPLATEVCLPTLQPPTQEHPNHISPFLQPAHLPLTVTIPLVIPPESLRLPRPPPPLYRGPVDSICIPPALSAVRAWVTAREQQEAAQRTAQAQAQEPPERDHVAIATTYLPCFPQPRPLPAPHPYRPTLIMSQLLWQEPPTQLPDVVPQTTQMQPQQEHQPHQFHQPHEAYQSYQHHRPHQSFQAVLQDLFPGQPQQDQSQQSYQQSYQQDCRSQQPQQPQQSQQPPPQNLTLQQRHLAATTMRLLPPHRRSALPPEALGGEVCLDKMPFVHIVHVPGLSFSPPQGNMAGFLLMPQRNLEEWMKPVGGVGVDGSVGTGIGVHGIVGSGKGKEKSQCSCLAHGHCQAHGHSYYSQKLLRKHGRCPKTAMSLPAILEEPSNSSLTLEEQQHLLELQEQQQKPFSIVTEAEAKQITDSLARARKLMRCVDPDLTASAIDGTGDEALLRNALFYLQRLATCDTLFLPNTYEQIITQYSISLALCTLVVKEPCGGQKESSDGAASSSSGSGVESGAESQTEEQLRQHQVHQLELQQLQIHLQIQQHQHEQQQQLLQQQLLHRQQEQLLEQQLQNCQPGQPAATAQAPLPSRPGLKGPSLDLQALFCTNLSEAVAAGTRAEPGSVADQIMHKALLGRVMVPQVRTTRLSDSVGGVPVSTAAPLPVGLRVDVPRVTIILNSGWSAWTASCRATPELTMLDVMAVVETTQRDGGHVDPRIPANAQLRLVQRNVCRHQHVPKHARLSRRIVLTRVSRGMQNNVFVEERILQLSDEIGIGERQRMLAMFTTAFFLQVGKKW